MQLKGATAHPSSNSFQRKWRQKLDCMSLVGFAFGSLLSVDAKQASDDLAERREHLPERARLAISQRRNIDFLFRRRLVFCGVEATLARRAGRHAGVARLVGICLTRLVRAKRIYSPAATRLAWAH